MDSDPRAGNYEVLYENGKYFVLSIPDSELMELGFLARGLNLNFTYQEWRRLREIIAGIELPENLGEGMATLYRDGTYLFTADDEPIRWVIPQRMIPLMWQHDEWREFQDVMARARSPEPWVVI